MTSSYIDPDEVDPDDPYFRQRVADLASRQVAFTMTVFTDGTCALDGLRVPARHVYPYLRAALDDLEVRGRQVGYERAPQQRHYLRRHHLPRRDDDYGQGVNDGGEAGPAAG